MMSLRNMKKIQMMLIKIKTSDWSNKGLYPRYDKANAKAYTFLNALVMQ